MFFDHINQPQNPFFDDIYNSASINGIRAVSLFSGCGGLDLGAHAAGLEIVYANDIDKDSCDTLSSFFSDTRIHQGDVGLVSSFPKAEILLGGYPCQSFSMGGNRDPEKDERTSLYRQFARALGIIEPLYFMAENVSGLQKIKKGHFLDEQIDTYSKIGKHGYRLSFKVVDAKNYGLPQTRKRLIIIGVRKDLGKIFEFPLETHGIPTKKRPTLLPYTSHGEAIKDLPLWPSGEFYERPHDPEGHFSWYFMSRNRKAAWDGPSYTVVANWRHITLHPASPTMKLTWSNLSDGWKQRWDFSDEYEHLIKDDTRPILKEARRLSWRECARIQTFPGNFEPVGKVESKFTQIGNAVPPLLAYTIINHLVSGRGLVNHTREDLAIRDSYRQLDIPF